MTNEELLAELFTATLEDLLKKVRSGEAKPGDVANAIRMLRDNSITAHAGEDSSLTDLEEALKGFDLKVINEE